MIQVCSKCDTTWDVGERVLRTSVCCIFFLFFFSVFLQATAAQAPLGPMGQHKHGYTPNYDAPVSFVTASNNNPVTAEASKSFALAQRAAQALGGDPRVRVP